MSNIQTIIDLGAELDRQRNAAFDLWSWLPSYKVAIKWHGDIASEYMPSIENILYEACIVMAQHKGHKLSKEDRKFLAQCPCGDNHQAEEQDRWR